MKKYMIFFILLLSLCFNQISSMLSSPLQTGMVTFEGESAMGLWGTMSKVIDCDNCSDRFGGALSYMMENGIELGVSYQIGDDVNYSEIESIILILQYHFKNIGNTNHAIWIRKHTSSRSSSNNPESEYDEDYTNLDWILYTDNLFNFGLKYSDDDDSNYQFQCISFGKIWNLKSFYIALDHAVFIEDGMFSRFFQDLDDGLTSIGIGVTF